MEGAERMRARISKSDSLTASGVDGMEEYQGINRKRGGIMDQQRIPKMRRFAGWAAILVAIIFGAGCTPAVEKLWEFPTSSALYSTPLVVGDLIVFGSESGTLHAVDRLGHARWQFQVPSSEIFAHPQTNGTLVFFGATNQTFYSVDLTGQAKWSFAAKERIKSDPTVLEGVVYLTSYDGHVYALNASTGKKMWQFPQQESQAAANAGSGTAAAAATPTPAGASSSDVPAGEPAPPPVSIKPESFSYAAPTIKDGVLYIGNLDGYMYALQTVDGSMKWRFMAGEGITSTAWVEEGVVYFGSKNDNVYAIDAATGTKVLWTFKTGGDILSSPRISNGVLAIGSNDGNFYALDAKDGKEKCRFKANGPIVSYGVFYQNLVFFNAGQGDGSIYAIDRDTCKLFWSYKTGYKVESDPTLENNLLYVTSGDMKLYAFKINKKEEK
jgi:eukaryotic-like serine/threonine-protein kinase